VNLKWAYEVLMLFILTIIIAILPYKESVANVVHYIWSSLSSNTYLTALYFYPDEGHNKIDWDKRFKIIKGICQGLRFLHKELDRPLVHMNLVPSSIWLDDNWVPKIADFGLSRLFGQEQTQVYTKNVVGQQ
jgi:serine/threonine protein kinase